MNLVDKAYNYSFDSLLKYIKEKKTPLPKFSHLLKSYRDLLSKNEIENMRD